MPINNDNTHFRAKIFDIVKDLTTPEGHWEDHENERPYKKIITSLAPRNILELGFNIGYSSIMWLEYTNANVTSVDICRYENTKEAAKRVKEKYGDRFNFVEGDTRYIVPRLVGKFDLVMVDAGHDYDAVKTDIENCLDLGIELFLFDNYGGAYGQGVKRAVDESNLVLVKLFDSHYDTNDIGLFKNG